MTRWMTSIFLLLIGMSAIWADRTNTGIIWPGWRIETSEEYGLAKYPITNMFDGDPSSTWVYNFRPNARNASHKPQTNITHGVGAEVIISRGRTDIGERSFSLDGIGIINGYAKNRSVYYRNNRIRSLRVTIDTVAGRAAWHKDFSLRETRTVQYLSLPRLLAYHIHLTVLKVAVGADNDLCISELALYLHKKQLPWNLTPIVAYNSYEETGASPVIFTLQTRQGKPLRPTWGSRFNGLARQLGTANCLLSDKHQIFLYDLAHNRLLFTHHFTAFPLEIGWTNTHTALIATGPDPFANPTAWYQLSLPGPVFHAIRKPRKFVKYQSEVWGPYYGS